MIIGIDASRAVNEGAGIGRYTREVVKALIDTATSDQFQLLFSFVRDDSHKRKWIEDIQSHKDNVQVKTSVMPGQLKEWLWGKPQWTLKRYFPGAEVLFAPSFFEAAVGEKTPQVVMMHDLSHALFPDQRGGEVSKRLTERNKEIAHIATKLIAPSESVKDDLVRLFEVAPAKIIVIPESHNSFFTQLPTVERQPFFLFLGTISPRKNLIGLLEAYAALPQEIRDEYKLKIAGADGWNTGPTYKTYQRLNLGDRVEFVLRIEDEALRMLYNQAAAFVFPVLHEGFGIPILEAMACGCPVITSSTSSLPEAAGDAAILVDPHNTGALTRAMEHIVTDPKLWAKLHRAGLTHATRFSWQKTAQQTLEVLHDVGKR